MTHCADGDPIIWLNDNWIKLIETVQALATKYGQERKDNNIGTISSFEAREALRKHNGNIWHAVTECIEQRQKAFNLIKEQGNFLREDIVTYLTEHHGNAEIALNELNRLQLKPFLLRVIGAPSGADNNSGNLMNNNQLAQDSVLKDASSNEKETNNSTVSEKNEDSSNIPNNSYILRDIEAIITSMEEKQLKQNETILHTIENLFGNIMAVAQNSRPLSSASSFSTLSFDRIDVKSPISIPSKTPEQERNKNVENDVRNFVSRHIQDIVPNVAALVNRELNEATQKDEKNSNQKNISSDENSNGQLIKDNNVDVVMPSKNTDANISKQELETSKISNDSIVIKATLPENVENVPSVEITPTNPKAKSKIKEAPNFLVNKGISRCNKNQANKRRIRELEKQLLLQERHNRNKANLMPPTCEERSDSRNTANLSDSTVIQEDAPESTKGSKNYQTSKNSSQKFQTDQTTLNSDVKTFSLSITEQEQVETEEPDYSRSLLDLSESTDLLTVSQSERASNIDDLSEFETESLTWTTSNLALMQSKNQPPGDLNESQNRSKKENRNISEMVQHTKNIIQQMKNEIDEDIAMSEFDDENDMEYNDGLNYDDESDNSDGWTDIDDDDRSDYDDQHYNYNNQDELMQNDQRFERSSESMESEQFEEAREEFSFAEQGNTFQSLNGSFEMYDSEHDGSLGDIEPIKADILDDDLVQSNYFENSENVIETSSGTVDLKLENVEQSNLLTIGSLSIAQDHQVPINVNHYLDTPSEVPDSNEIIDEEPDIVHSNENIVESIIEIQQSLQSGIITLNKSEGPNIEKSASREFSNTPDMLDSGIQKEMSEEVTAPELVLSNETDEERLVTESPDLVSINVVYNPDIGANFIEHEESNIQELVQDKSNNFNVENLQEYEFRDEGRQEHQDLDNSNGNIENEKDEEIEEVEEITDNDQNEVDVQVKTEQNGIEEEIEEDEEKDEEEEEEYEEEEYEEEVEDEEEVDVEIIEVSEDEKIEQEIIAQTNQFVVENIEPNTEPGPSRTRTPEVTENDTMNHAETMTTRTSSTEEEISEVEDVSTSSSSESKETPAGKTDNSISKETLVESYQYKKITIPVLTDCCQSSINVLQLEKVEQIPAQQPALNETAKTTTKNTTKNRIPVRRISISEPSASIKKIQDELLNKNKPPIGKNPGKKPSKIVPPKLFFKSSFTAITNKVADLITPNKSNSTNKLKKSAEQQANKSNAGDGPKKKYFETCFSDDYQTSDDEKTLSTAKKTIPLLVRINETKAEEILEPEVNFKTSVRFFYIYF